MQQFELSKRLQSLPPYLFAEIDKEKIRLRKLGKTLIDLGIGDPDILAPKRVSEVLARYSLIKQYQKYPLDSGLPSFKQAISVWSKQRFKIKLDPETEILPLIGSKEGLIHFPLAFVNPNETILVPSPGYPGYTSACALSGAKAYYLPLLAEKKFLPDLNKIPLTVRNKAKLIYLNYPNNPTSVLAPKNFLESLVRFCVKYGIIIVYDNAYSEIYFDQKPLSILEIKGAREIAIEFHSLSKTFCMTGFRVGWAAGNSQLVKGLAKVKTNVDSGLFFAIQKAAEEALLKEQGYIHSMCNVIAGRRKVMLDVLKCAGFSEVYCQATFYVWAKLPKAYKSSIDYAKHLLLDKGIVVTPGVGFGKYGEGYIRFALTLDKNILRNTAGLLR